MTPSKPPGWYPDAATAGTRYWDGSEWTGDVRPPRRPFAAESRDSDAAYLTGYFGTTFGGGIAVLSSVDGSTVGLALGCVILALTVVRIAYLLRGRGPTTKAVQQRMAPPPAWEQREVRSGSKLLGAAAIAVAAAAAASASASASRRPEDAGEPRSLSVPAGLALRRGYQDVRPVLAMRARHDGNLEVTLDGRTWEQPDHLYGDWVTADGKSFSW